MGIAPILSDVRICHPSLGSKGRVGLTASPIYEVGPTRLSSRRDISGATSLERTSMEVDQSKVVGSVGEKRDLGTSRVGFEPSYYAVLYFESSMSTCLLTQGNVSELRSPILLYGYTYMPVNRRTKSLSLLHLHQID